MSISFIWLERKGRGNKAGLIEFSTWATIFSLSKLGGKDERKLYREEKYKITKKISS